MDFNGDGVPDIALLMTPPPGDTTEVRVLFGRGRFSLDPPVVTSLGAGVRGAGLGTGDFDRDGRTDLVFGVMGSLDVRMTGLMMGQGDGRFAEPTFYEGASWQPAAGDFNRDGKLDLIVNDDGTTPSLYSLRGDGAGALFAARGYRVPDEVRASHAADVNGDGKMDLILIGGNAHGMLSVSALMNRGDTRLVATLPSRLLPSHFRVSSAVGDFDEDGKPDTVLSTITVGQGALIFFHGQGDGTFAAPREQLVAAFPRDLSVADFNQDGHLDLVSANAASGDIAIYLGNGDGTFQPPARYPANYGATSPQVGDVNRDGKLDVLVWNRDAGGRYHMMSVLLGTGDGTVQPALAIDPFVGYSDIRYEGFFLNDWDRDGRLDVLLCAQGRVAIGPPTGNFSGLLLLRGDGKGGFSRGPVSPLTDPCPTLIGDLNGDKAPDLVTSWYGGRSILLSQGDGTFTTATHDYSIKPSIYGALADLNNDGKLDLIDTIGQTVLLRLNTTP